MKSNARWLLFLLLVLALTACQAQTTPAVVQTEAVVESYPAPQAAAVQEPTTPPDVLYPDSQSGDTVSWSQAAAMIVNGEVSEIRKMAGLEATLVLKDGRTLLTAQRTTADIAQTLMDCGEPCTSITVTEP